ncbi:E3 ubiquitin-protein ligase RNF123 isoform X2 [Folsomia candida]|uniref:E3 ubiquitin-protein ligase RNF123 isoform X2 n=1 Tax=Folsomia candida TaxID=158441 RepID=UPI000B902FFF|nr:E3 ubiquitin-protein ligase RNF123 isoform X2 [Folsomia candida]
MSTEAPPSGHSPTTGKGHDVEIGLSRTVLTQIFGNEFVSTLLDSYQDVGGVQTPNSDEILHPSPAKSHLVSNDGPSKPKTPRTSAKDPTTLEDLKTLGSPNSPNFLDHLAEHMQRQLDRLEETERRQMDAVQHEGRLGPTVVKMDVGSHVGSFIISTDRLGVSSQCNFGSVRACACVYKGKWQYEVQLGSNGVMQVGWATLETKFSQEKGVGDTIDSFAYDGNRLRKWNKSTAQYGETWQAGDIVGSCIDMDSGSIEFFRNGRSLGVAFTEIRRGPKIAYFPAVSLAYQENIVANFGATPLQFPVVGYSPIQSLPRTADNMKSTLLLSWFEKLLPYYRNNEFNETSTNEYKALLVISNRIMEFLGPNLYSGFVVEQSFYPFFARILGLPEKISHADKISSSSYNELNYDRVILLLDIMWTLLEESEMKSCLERFCVVLMNQFRSNSMSMEYPFQRYSLLCLIALVKHRKTRRHFIRSLLLDRSGRLVHFLHVRPMDESILASNVPETWWPGKGPKSVAYERACNVIQQQVSVIENLQIMLLKVLLTNNDGTDRRPSSRALFLRKFRVHVRDVIRPGSVLHQPIQKAMCCFFSFLRTISELYSEEVEHCTEIKFPNIPPCIFYDTSVAYHDMERVGGLASYLYKAHHTDIATKLSIPDYIQEKPAATSSEQPDPSVAGSSLTGSPVIIQVSTSAATADDNIITRDMAIAAASPDIIMTIPHRFASPPPPPPLPPAPPVAMFPTMGSPPFPREVTPPATEPASATSSDGALASAPPPTTTQFGALITGTPSGHNLLIPMMTDFRTLEQGFTFYPGGFVGFTNIDHRTSVQPKNPAVALLGKDSGSIDPLFSLRELLDDAIIIYCSGVQANVEKVVTLRTTIDSYEEALKQANANLASVTTSSERDEIVRSIEIFTNKLEEQSRHMAWVKSSVFTKERQTYVYKLLRVVLDTLRLASTEGNLFTFVPEHYISTLINLNWLIVNQMHPTVASDNLPDLAHLLSQVAEFVATHFADTRIVIAETKDTLTQALSTFICNRQMLTALEEMPGESQLGMIKAILRPYENRAWAQSNWMLVRMWQGDGFAFQYPNSWGFRRSYRAKPVQDEFGISTNLPPTPSKVFQNHIANVLMNDQTFAVSFLHSVLNQLNWAFSEFVGLLQEIQSASARPERVFVESRQLKICCTCFELTQALLRVMEMVVNIAPPVLTDFTRDSAEPLLGRLSMLLSQVINRIGSNTGCFANVIDLDIPGLENVTHYPILSAVAGIIVGMILPDLDKTESDITATKTVLNEPSFESNSMDFFIGRNQSHVPEGRRIFSLRDYVPLDVSEGEMHQLDSVINHLNSWSEKLLPETGDIDDDAICTICYAYPKNATLKPCNHRTCKSCILHHLMNRGDCFFCKAPILQVFLDDGTKIHDTTLSSTEPNERSNHRRS